MDFPEEDVPALEDAQLVSTLTAVEGELDTLIRNYDAGAVLREGVDCAIVGRPNAGKSTLLNLLAGSTGPSSPPWRAPPGMWWSRLSGWGTSG